MSGPADPRLRLRLYIDGALADEVWIDSTSPLAQEMIAEAQADHQARAAAATDRGQLWMVEIYDPAQPDPQAYIRFGTDARGMERPTVTVDLVGDVLGGDPCP